MRAATYRGNAVARSCLFVLRDPLYYYMIPRILVGLALCAAIPSPASAQTPSSWKSFKIGTLASFSNPFTVRPDGRFLYGGGR